MTRPASMSDAADALEANAEAGMTLLPTDQIALAKQLRAWGDEYQRSARVLVFPGQHRARGRGRGCGPDGDAA